MTKISITTAAVSKESIESLYPSNRPAARPELRIAGGESINGVCDTSTVPSNSPPASAIDSSNSLPPHALAGSIVPDDLVDPFTGEIIAPDDIDSLIDAYERTKKVNDTAYAFIQQIRTTAASLTEGDAKTRRIRGKRRSAKIEMPSESFEQRLLKQIWESCHSEGNEGLLEACEEVLKVDSIGVKMREYKKLIGTSGDEEFNDFRDAVSKSSRGCVGLPTLTVEK